MILITVIYNWGKMHLIVMKDAKKNFFNDPEHKVLFTLCK